jgi:polysaccharide biosynthesis transport protein
MGSAQNYVSTPRRPPDVEDYIEMARRYRSWMIGPMFAGLVISVVVGFLWPDRFISQATLRIIPQQVPEKLVPSAITMQLSERLLQMQTEILSRTTLTEIINKQALNLYPAEKADLPMEDVVNKMKNRDVSISPLQELGAIGGRRYASAFVIQFSYPDRYKAQAVVRELASRFTEQNFTVQKNQAQITSDFLNTEVRAAKERMDAKSAALTKFMAENQGRLPQQEQANAQALSVAQIQLMSAEQAMDRARQDLAQINVQLENNRAQQAAAQANLEEVIPGTTSVAVRNESLVNINKDLAAANAALASLRQRFGANHPDVNNQLAIIDNLEKRRLELETAELSRPVPQGSGPMRVSNPSVQKALDELKAAERTLRVQATGKQSDIERSQRDKAQTEKDIATLRKRLEESPLNTQMWASLNNDFALAKADYEDKVKKVSVSETAQNLEDRKAGETLELLDQATLPEKPASPNRPMWAALGTFAGLGIGVLLATAKELKDTSLKNLKDVRAYTNMPILSSIPLLENALLVRRKRRLGWAAWSCGVMLGFAMMGGAMYYYMSQG